MSSRVTVALKPVGEIPFDGLVLPMLSPDGMRLATQVGQAPTWEALLGAPDADAPYRTRLEVYDISGATPARVAGAALPAGWMLGRAADDRRFLTEVMNPDGSRHIAAVPWEGGAPEWIVRDDSVNAHGAWLADGTPIYCTRDQREPRFAIAVGSGAGVSVYTDPEASLLFPVPTPDPGRFYCYALTRTAGLELRLVRADAGKFAVESVWPLLGGTNASALDAYQCAARAAVRPEPPHELLAIHPRLGGLAVFDPATGSVGPLRTGSIAGAWLASGDPLRVFLTARDGLMHQQAARVAGGLSPSEAVRVLREPWVPVSTTDPDFPWVLIGPEDDAADPALVLVRMALASPTDAAPVSPQSPSE